MKKGFRWFFAATLCAALGVGCSKFSFFETYRLESVRTGNAVGHVNQVTTIQRSFLGIPVRTVTVTVPNGEVNIGGSLVGLSLESNGVRIMGSQFVETEDGPVNTLEGSDVKEFDILMELNGIRVNSQKEIAAVLAGTTATKLPVKLLRGDQTVESVIGVAVNRFNNRRVLGLWVKDHMNGIGTLTFVKDDKFATLGHAINDESKMNFPTRGGSIYPCELLGIQKGSDGNPGHVKGTFSETAEKLGVIEKNNDFGVYGKELNGKLKRQISDRLPNKKRTDRDRRADGNPRVRCKPRQQIKLGKAQVITAVSGELAVYDIEIMKTSNQKSPKTRGMVIRVTDPKLIELTGGIVQGMSGSPILQDGQFIGAVTHVFNNDSKKGFALYGDFMVEQVG